ncbi:MAG TPA: hypothetical protein VGW74_20710, partial [Propionibacteriaceae bacterium]|nr:hypothetical protein [Propionibacteriaceae bacterium]
VRHAGHPDRQGGTGIQLRGMGRRLFRDGFHMHRDRAARRGGGYRHLHPRVIEESFGRTPAV